MQVVGWSGARVRRFASVERWLANYPERTQQGYAWFLSIFLSWLSQREGFEDVTPDLLVQMQKLTWSDEDPDAKYRMVDLLAEFVRNSTLKGRSSRAQAFSIVRGFFGANRAPLPEDRSIRILGEPPHMSLMTDSDLRKIVMAATLRDRSWLLVKILGFMGWKELEYMNLHCGQQVMKQLKKDVLRVDFPMGRKRNPLPFYTLFGGSARESLKQFIDELRGPIRDSEAIWYTKYGEPMRRRSFFTDFRYLTVRVGLFSPDMKGKEYAYGGHETRDIVRSLWHRSKADRDCAEFMMGHVVDKNKYDKIYKLDPAWVEDEYRLALPHIDILNQQEKVPEKVQERISKLEADFAELKRKFETQR